MTKNLSHLNSSSASSMSIDGDYDAPLFEFLLSDELSDFFQFPPDSELIPKSSVSTPISSNNSRFTRKQNTLDPLDELFLKFTNIPDVYGCHEMEFGREDPSRAIPSAKLLPVAKIKHFATTMINKSIETDNGCISFFKDIDDESSHVSSLTTFYSTDSSSDSECGYLPKKIKLNRPSKTTAWYQTNTKTVDYTGYNTLPSQTTPSTIKMSAPHGPVHTFSDSGARCLSPFPGLHFINAASTANEYESFISHSSPPLSPGHVNKNTSPCQLSVIIASAATKKDPRPIIDKMEYPTISLKKKLLAIPIGSQIQRRLPLAKRKKLLIDLLHRRQQRLTDQRNVAVVLQVSDNYLKVKALLEGIFLCKDEFVRDLVSPDSEVSIIPLTSLCSTRSCRKGLSDLMTASKMLTAVLSTSLRICSVEVVEESSSANGVFVRFNVIESISDSTNKNSNTDVDYSISPSAPEIKMISGLTRCTFVNGSIQSASICFDVAGIKRKSN